MDKIETKIIRKCINCGKEFEPNRADQLYCSPSCRVIYNRNQRKLEQIEQKETESSLLEQKTEIEKLQSKVTELENTNLSQRAEVSNLRKQLEQANQKLANYESNDADKMTIRIGRRERGIYEMWCELWEKEMPENQREWIEIFKRMGFAPNTYNMPVLACVRAFMGFDMPDFVSLTRENIDAGAERYKIAQKNIEAGGGLEGYLRYLGLDKENQ